jgi:hypothetical protein
MARAQQSNAEAVADISRLKLCPWLKSKPFAPRNAMPRTLKISAKCSDLCSIQLIEDGKHVGEYDGYVPSWLPNPNVQHYGDYVELEIDVDTGKILNWKKPTKADLTQLTK